MAQDRFRCLTNAGEDLCFNGGVCTINSPELQTCTCDPSSFFGPDNVLFHQNNCTLPNNALLGLFIANCIIAVIEFVFMYKAGHRASPKTMRALVVACLIIVAFLAELLALYLENGWYVATSIIVIFVLNLLCIWGVFLGETIALPLFSLSTKMQGRVRKTMYVTFSFISAILTTSLVAMAATAYGDGVAFNKATIAFVMCQFFSMVLFYFAINYYCYKLKALASTLEIASRSTLLVKLHSIQRGTFYLVSGQITGVSSVVIFWILGSVPYLWVFMFVSFTGLQIGVVMATLGMFKTLKPGSSSLPTGGTTDANNKVVAVKHNSRSNETAVEPIAKVSRVSSKEPAS